MSEPNTTVTDFSPICPHCGEYVENLNHALLVELINEYAEPLILDCKECHGQFTIECHLMFTMKKPG